VESLLQYDQQLLLYLNSLGDSAYDWFWLLLTHKATNAVVYLSLSLLYAKKYGWVSFLYLFGWTLLLVGFTDQITNGFKYGFERLRPCHEPGIMDQVRLVKKSCGGLYSFFSGHASNSFALATLYFLSLKQPLRNGRFLLFGLAILIAYSRVYIGVHYPLDFFCGALFGLVAGTLFYRFGRRFKIIQS